MVSGKDVDLARDRLLCEGWDDSAEVLSDMEKIIKAQVRKQKIDAKHIRELEEQADLNVEAHDNLLAIQKKLETAIIRERAISIEFARAASSGRIQIVEPEESSKITAEHQLRRSGIL
jgi:hypothetical protein